MANLRITSDGTPFGMHGRELLYYSGLQIELPIDGPGRAVLTVPLVDVDLLIRRENVHHAGACPHCGRRLALVPAGENGPPALEIRTGPCSAKPARGEAEEAVHP